MTRSIRSVSASFFFLLLLASGQLPGQQVMPRLMRQIDEPPGVTLKTNSLNQDPQGRLWITTHNGFVRYDGRKFQVFHDPVLRKGDYYYHSMPSPDGRVWLKLDQGYALPYFDPQHQQIRRVPNTTRLIRQYLAKGGCHYLFPDADANLWIGLRGQGLLRFNPRTLAVDHVFTKPVNVRWITQDRRGLIWFTSDQGLYTYDPVSGRTTNYFPDPRRPHTSLGSRFTYGVHIRPDGTILVGLNNEIDVLNPVSGQIRRVQLIPSARLPRQEVYEFFDDPAGNTYFLTPTTAYRYTKRGILERVELQPPLQPPADFYASRANQLWVSAGQKLYAYDLSQVRALPSLNLLDVVINGTRLEANSTDRRLERDSLGRTTLTLQENDLLSVRFSPYAGWKSSAFRFRLEGFDRQWNVDEGLDATASYQLPAGHYTFALNGAREGGGWQPQTAALRVVVQPFFWKTTWFLLLISLLIISGLIVLYRSFLRRQTLRRELNQRKVEADNLRQLDEMKSRFFTNITHEFRTPLTLILSPAEQLLREAQEPTTRRRLATIESSARQLLGLINQLMDLTKLDAGMMPVRESVGNLNDFVAGLTGAFQEQADARTITLWVEGQLPGDYWFDADKLEQIMVNLLSNALKFTPDGGRITVTFQTDEPVTLTVSDSGIGIAADKLPLIFNRFYQVDDSATRRNEGTGIGLALVNELVERQGGRIRVESEVGAGTTFTVYLPYRPALPTEVVVTAIPSLPELDRPGDQAEAVPDDAPAVLLVEDNPELADFIAESLPPSYRIYRAINGVDGLEQALQLIPDLVISDVLMPEMDGYAFCHALKQDIRTSHVPVVLLTAKSSVESRLEGLAQGADDYITKPFHLPELQLRVQNLLTNRRRLRERIRHELSRPSPPENNLVTEQPDAFLRNVYALIESNLDNADFGTSELMAQTHMSRMSLYRKLKNLTALAPGDLIRMYRLKRAAQYLTKGHSVSETAYMVGFETPSYFTKAFRSQYQMTPTQFVSQARSLVRPVQ